ncbi:glutaredoxin 3 [Chromatiales bacterium (ex Bugula neritina AB1)]|nr:glutaredoxin 3 [Chromatiales bacterium (ex Bugula neritina AB1)]
MSENSNVLIYATGLCGFCKAAMRLLDKKNVVYETIRVDQDHEQLDIMKQRSGRRTVPQIFVGDHHIGGFDDLSELEATGQLDQVLSG